MRSSTILLINGKCLETCTPCSSHAVLGKLGILASYSDVFGKAGSALGLGPDAAADGVTVAEETFGFAAGTPTSSWDEVTFYWACPACGETVSDHGPGHVHPEDVESDHPEDCTREVCRCQENLVGRPRGASKTTLHLPAECRAL